MERPEPIIKPWWIYVRVVPHIKGRKAWNLPFFVQISKKYYGEDGSRSAVLQQELFESMFWAKNLWKMPYYALRPRKWAELECLAHAIEVHFEIQWGDVYPNRFLFDYKLEQKARSMEKHSTYWYFRKAKMDFVEIEMLIRSHLEAWKSLPWSMKQPPLP